MSEKVDDVNLFERDGFTMSITNKFEGHEVTFTQWEAKCYNSLKHDNEHLHELVKHLRGQLEWERSRYIDLIIKRTEQKGGHEPKPQGKDV